MRYFEDFRTGDVYELGTITVTTEEVLEFGRRFDPQAFHTDLELAARSPFGGLIASGWHTASMFMRRYVDGLLAYSACTGSPGVDEIRYVRPVRPGDVLTARVEILGSRPSPFNPTTGIVQPKCLLVDHDGTVVFSMILHSIFQRRPADPDATYSGTKSAAEDPVACVRSMA
ncbi:MaoC/PaaZ C-terminal domain-containing protein [Streptomyces sp. ISL-86]|uniref:MaoC/PaaZ C-terminal domain-containing protein n=1 Tax=Streptomyces sp. ISL-86 TaxID=2819187 RepID=UPI001BEA8170|nr:MaoC/PaaZ C-terminal domain-containing protein [Streptomyces sp. ISL-86]MBT2454551.1 dehydratase [Streptomyces sp. ISL-86]